MGANDLITTKSTPPNIIIFGFSFQYIKWGAVNTLVYRPPSSFTTQLVYTHGFMLLHNSPICLEQAFPLHPYSMAWTMEVLLFHQSSPCMLLLYPLSAFQAKYYLTHVPLCISFLMRLCFSLGYGEEDSTAKFLSSSKPSFLPLVSHCEVSALS